MSSRLDRTVAFPALAAALLVLGVQVVLQLVSLLLTAVTFTSNAPGGYLVSLGLGYLSSVVLRWLPFVLGVFLTLWFLVPLAAGLRLWPVILRSILATAGGALILFLVSLLAGLFSGMSVSEGRVFGWGSAILGSVASGFDSGFGYALFTALSAAVGLLPLTVLAGVLVWLRLREHPGDSARPGASGEV
jgi:hypothetical protein